MHLYLLCWPILLPQSIGTKSSFLVPVTEKKYVAQTPSPSGWAKTNLVKSSLSWQMLLPISLIFPTQFLLVLSMLGWLGFTKFLVLVLIVWSHVFVTGEQQMQMHRQCNKLSKYYSRLNTNVTYAFKVPLLSTCSASYTPNASLVRIFSNE